MAKSTRTQSPKGATKAPSQGAQETQAGSAATTTGLIRIRGARQNNLRGVDVDLPRGLPGGDHRAFRLGQVVPGL